ncbi:MAG: hypothetical protein R3C99_13030 [Pirellulaceae bacterium]
MAWAYLDLATVRSGPDGEKLAAGRAENPLAELIAGGVLDNLTRAPYAAASLEFNTHRARLQFTLPHDAGQVAESRQYYFGPNGAGQAPPLLAAEGRILAISMYRQFSEMWLRAGDLYDDNVNDEIAKAESNLTTLFSGKDFGEDILGAFGPESQLIVARQSFADDQPRPAIQLPAFALAFRLNDPATMQPELRRTFQSLVGFLNIVGVMNGQPQLDLDMEKTETTQIVSASYLPPTDTDNPLPGGGAKINYNFSPTVAFSGDRFVLASTTGLARELIASRNQTAKPTTDTDSAAADAASSDTATINTAAQLNFAELLAILEANREQLIAQNMLSDGNSREEASAQIDALFTLLSRGRQAMLRLDQPAGALRLQPSDYSSHENREASVMPINWDTIDPAWAWSPYQPSAEQSGSAAARLIFFAALASGKTAAELVEAAGIEPAAAVEQLVGSASDGGTERSDPALRRPGSCRAGHGRSASTGARGGPMRCSAHRRRSSRR